AAAGIEPANKGFADLRLTTWLRRHISTPAGNQPRKNEEDRGSRIENRLSAIFYLRSSIFDFLRFLRFFVFDFHDFSSPSSRRAQPAQPFDQNLRDFGPRELDRRNLALRKHLAHAGAAQADVVRLIVRAGLERGHPVAPAAEERVVKEHRRD